MFKETLLNKLFRKRNIFANIIVMRLNGKNIYDNKQAGYNIKVTYGTITMFLSMLRISS